MKKAIVILLSLLPIVATSQIGFGNSYSDKDLLALLQNAKTSGQQIDATGLLANHFKQVYKDSLSKYYFGIIDRMAKNATDKNIVVKVLWWKAEQHTLEALNDLLEYSQKTIEFEGSEFIIHLPVH